MNRLVWTLNAVGHNEGIVTTWEFYAQVSALKACGVTIPNDEGVWRFQAIRYRSTKLDTGRYESLLVYGLRWQQVKFVKGMDSSMSRLGLVVVFHFSWSCTEPFFAAPATTGSKLWAFGIDGLPVVSCIHSPTPAKFIVKLSILYEVQLR